MILAPKMSLSASSVPVKSPFPVTFKFPPMFVTEPTSSVPPMSPLPVTVKLPPRSVSPDALRNPTISVLPCLPPTWRFSAIPTPPATVNAPVVVLVEPFVPLSTTPDTFVFAPIVSVVVALNALTMVGVVIRLKLPLVESKVLPPTVRFPPTVVSPVTATLSFVSPELSKLSCPY